MSIFVGLSFAVLGIPGTLFFSIVQGGLVWLLAMVIARLMGWSHWTMKLALIAVSWFVWVVGGVLVWSLLGGSFGLFEGGMPFVAVLPTGIYGAVTAMILWLWLPSRGRKKVHA